MNNSAKIFIAVVCFFPCFAGKAQNNTVWTFYQCIEQGWEANINVQQSELNMQNAAYDLEKSRAQYHPNLNASYTNGFNWGRSVDPTSYQYVNGLVNTNNVGVSAKMVLFDGFVTPTRIRQSMLGLELAGGQLDQQKNLIAMNIASAYLQTLLAYEKADLITKQLAATRTLLNNTINYFNQDLKSEGDVLLVKSQIAKEISDSVLAINTLQLAKLSLIQLMEIPYSADFTIERFDPDFSQSFVSYVMPSSQVIFDSAVTRLPEISNAILNVTYSELELKAAKGNYYPTVSLNGSVGSNYASTSKIITHTTYEQEIPIGYVYSNPSELVYGNEVYVVPTASDYMYFDQLNDNITTSLSIGLSVPIYNRKQVSVSVDKAAVNVNKAELDLQSQKNTLRKDIETDYLEYTLLRNQLEAGKIKLNAYQESYQKMEKRFELQLSGSYELMLEKNKISTTESEIVQLQYQLLFRYIILRYYQTGQVEFPYQN